MAVVGPNGAGKSTLFKGVVGALKPLAGRIERNGVRSAGHRLSAAGRRDRPQLPDQRLRHGGDGAVARAKACSAASAPRTGIPSRAPSRPWASPASSSARSARCPAARCSACCSRGCCCRTPASSCSTSRSTPSTPRPLPICWNWCGAGIASSAPCWRRCTISIWCERISPRRCCSPASRWPGARPPKCSPPDNMLKARRMCEAFDEQAEACVVAEAV